MEITNAEFVISNTDVKKCPAGTFPEYAFIGRSNVGKSSLINMLTGRKGLAMTSATPVEPPIVDKDGCRVKIINKTVSVYDANGKLLRQEDIIDYTRTNIKGEYASLSDFIRKWKTSDKKKTIEESFMAMGIDLKALKADQGMEDVDDFDFICYVAYGKKPLTRKERANNVKKKDFFSKYSADAQAVLDILLDKYMNQGITEVEDIKVLSLADFANYGKPAKIVKLFGGKEQYVAAVRELEASIYEEVEVG